MALIVEDGSGKTDADAYIAVADVETYLADHGNASAEWTAASTAEKESAVRRATQFLDAVYGPRFSGVKKVDNQRLQWPRAYALDMTGESIDSDSLPRAIIEACAELTNRQVASPLFPDRDTEGEIGREKVKVGPIEVDTTYVGSAGDMPGYGYVDAILSSLLGGESHMPVENG
jgi:hypothetical protein